MAGEENQFRRRGRGRPRKDDPVTAEERVEIRERQSWQFDALLAKRPREARYDFPKAADERTGGVLPSEADPERAGVVARGAPVAKPIKHRVRPRKNTRRRRVVPLDLEELLAGPPDGRQLALRHKGRSEPPKGWTRLDQLLAGMAAAWADPDVWVTRPEIDQALKGILHRDDIALLLIKGQRKGWIDRREVRDPIADRIDIRPGETVPRALFRLSRAGRALVALLG